MVSIYTTKMNRYIFDLSHFYILFFRGPYFRIRNKASDFDSTALIGPSLIMEQWHKNNAWLQLKNI
jgi:hypothetical protein